MDVTLSVVPYRYLDGTLPEAAAGPVAREDIYRSLNFPQGVNGPQPRPYAGINMVSTVDGKVVIGGPGTTHLIGSETDHWLMGRIDAQVDAVLFGAGLVREDDPPYPSFPPGRAEERRAGGLRPSVLWAVVSTRGEFAQRPRMLQVERENTALFVSSLAGPERLKQLSEWTQVFVCGEREVDPLLMGGVFRDRLGVNRLMSLGGPKLNASLIEAGAIDELFLTLAPKIQGGSGWETAVEGAGFAADLMPRLELLSLYGDGSELYLRYRLRRSADEGKSGRVLLSATGA
jgi:riboflavin biosynthesis pyrimidine reductase